MTVGIMTLSINKKTLTTTNDMQYNDSQYNDAKLNNKNDCNHKHNVTR
jgi:hypothetical protein